MTIFKINNYYQLLSQPDLVQANGSYTLAKPWANNIYLDAEQNSIIKIWKKRIVIGIVMESTGIYIWLALG